MDPPFFFYVTPILSQFSTDKEEDVEGKMTSPLFKGKASFKGNAKKEDNPPSSASFPLQGKINECEERPNGGRYGFKGSSPSFSCSLP